MAIIPSATNGATVQFGFASGQTGFISPVNPTIVSFDETTPNLPSNIYFTTNNTALAFVQVLFW